MKRAAVIGLMLVYLFSATGVTVTNFYCCGSLKSASLSIGDSYGDFYNSSPDTGNCCKTIKQVFKVRDQHFVSGVFFTFAKSAPIVFASTFQQTGLANDMQKYVVFNCHAPPRWQSEAIYTWTCTYRIWFNFFSWDDSVLNDLVIDRSRNVQNISLNGLFIIRQ